MSLNGIRGSDITGQRLQQGHTIRDWNRDSLIRKGKKSKEWEWSRELKGESKGNESRGI